MWQAIDSNSDHCSSFLDEFNMFEKSLTDLIRGIRANKKNEQKYISVCLQEIRNEVKANDIDVKANAIAKLTYVSEQEQSGY
jgi:hypothetical protein